MSRPIQETPELYGRDARRFLQASLHHPSEAQKLAERARIDASVSSLLAFARG